MVRKARGRGRAAGAEVRPIAAQDRICNVVQSRSTERDWLMTDALASGAMASIAAVPAAVDLRQPWWAVGEQGVTGSCVGWATADGVVRWHMVKAGRLSKTEPLSPRFVWMASKETDAFVSRPETFIEESGTSLKAAVDICRKFGTVTNALLPFNISTLMYTGSGSTFFSAASTRKVTAYYNLFKNTDQWKSWLASHGPILVALQVDRTWDNAKATGGNLDTFYPTTVRGGHAVSIVGYTTSGRFIVRNSWGVGWGDKGFGYASVGYINAAFYNESYGVTI